MTFTLHCDPPRTTHQRKQIVRVGIWTRLADKPELVAAKGMLDSLLLPHQPAAPIAGPVSMSLEFTWPWLGGHSKRVRALGRIPHISKPDLTNVAKTLEDRLVALRFIEDDRSVVSLTLTKWWGDAPGIVISVASFTGADTWQPPSTSASDSSPSRTGIDSSLFD